MKNEKSWKQIKRNENKKPKKQNRKLKIQKKSILKTKIKS